MITVGTITITANPTNLPTGANPIAPGDWIDRTVTLNNGGELTWSGVTLGITDGQAAPNLTGGFPAHVCAGVRREHRAPGGRCRVLGPLDACTQRLAAAQRLHVWRDEDDAAGRHSGVDRVELEPRLRRRRPAAVDAGRRPRTWWSS